MAMFKVEVRIPRSVLSKVVSGSRLGLKRKSMNPAFRVTNGRNPPFAGFRIGPNRPWAHGTTGRAVSSSIYFATEKDGVAGTAFFQAAARVMHLHVESGIAQ